MTVDPESVTIVRSYRPCDALRSGTYAASVDIPLCQLPLGHKGNHETHRRDIYGLVRVTGWAE